MGKYTMKRLEKESIETKTSLKLIIEINKLNELAELNRLKRMDLQRISNDCYSPAQIKDEANL